MYNIKLAGLDTGREYYVKVRAKVNGYETSEWSLPFKFSTPVDTMPPGRVENLTFISEGDSFIANWNAPQFNQDGSPCGDISHYKLMLKDLDRGTVRQERSIETSFTIDINRNAQIFGPLAGRIELIVTAIDLSGNEGKQVIIVAQNPPPAQVKNVTASVGVEAIALKWDANIETDLAHYEIHVGSTSGFTPGTSTLRAKVAPGSDSFTYDTASLSTVYFKLIAVDKFSQRSPASDVASAQPRLTTDYDKEPPVGVTGLTVTQVLSPDSTSSIARVSYTLSSESDLDKYELQYRKTGETVVPWSFSNVPSDQTSAEIKPLPLSTSYDFKIRAVDFNSNKGAWSSVVVAPGVKKTTKPAAPTAVTVNGGSSNLMITWNASTDSSMSSWAGVYEVQISKASSFTSPTTIKTASTLASFTSLDQNTVYYARIRSIDPYNNIGLWSTAASGNTGVTADLNASNVYWSETEPVAGKANDIWIKLPDNVQYRYNGTNWVKAQDQELVDSQGSTTVYGPTDPVGTHKNGDTWYKTPEYVAYLYQDGTWVKAQDTELSGDITSAQQTADGKNTVWYQSAMPPLIGNKTGDTWYDTLNGNKVHLWSETNNSWTNARDEAIDEALNSSADAQSTADGKNIIFYSIPTVTPQEGDTWFDGPTIKQYKNGVWSDVSKGLNNTKADQALTVAGQKNKTFYVSKNSATGMELGDLLFDPTDKFRPYRYNGSTWIDIRDTTISDAASVASGALSAANGKNTIYYATPPATGLKEGDTWFDGTIIKQYKNGTWVDVSSSLKNNKADEAWGIAGDKNKTYYVTYANRPTTGLTIGDLLFDTGNKYKQYRYTGTSWASVQDGTIADADTKAQTALNTANTKSQTFYEASKPANTSGRLKLNDLWIRSSDNQLHRWSGTDWTEIQDDAIALTQSNLTTAIGDLQTAIGNVESIADGKINTFISGTKPTVGLDVGDIWFNTAVTPIAVNVYDGTDWKLSGDKAALDAATAVQTNLNATNLALNKKNTTYAQTSAPTAGLIIGDLWLNTTVVSGTPKNELNRWNGSNWIVTQDKSIFDAQALADGKAAVFTRSTQPTNAESQLGDVWFDSSQSPWEVRVRTGSSVWTVAGDGTARTAAATAQTEAARKIQSFYIDTDPATIPANNVKAGDLWYKTTDKRARVRATNNTWVELKDTSIAEAKTAADNAKIAADAAQVSANNAITNAGNAFDLADGKANVYWQASPGPTGLVTADKGDIWVNTSKTPNEINAWSGTAWAVTGDPATKTIAEAAATLAGQKSYTYIENNAPTASSSPAPQKGDIWIKNNVTPNLVSIYTGSAWVESGDKSARDDAATKAYIHTTTNATAPTSPTPKRGDVWINTATGLTKIRTATAWVDTTDPEARTIANRKVTTYYTPAAPTAPTGGFTTGDLWVRTTDNRMHRWAGSWAELKDKSINDLESLTGTIVNSLIPGLEGQIDNKIEVFVQTGTPTITDAAKQKGDIWINPTTGEIKVYSGTQWIVSTDPAANALATTAQSAAAAANTAAGNAQTTADKKMQTFYGTTGPANSPVGTIKVNDLWINSTNKRLHRWTGSVWEDAKDSDITAAQNAANAAQSSANTAISNAGNAFDLADGKANVFWQAAAPTGMAPADKGDIWVNTSKTPNEINAWSGTIWTVTGDPATKTIAEAAATLAGTKAKTFVQTGTPTGMVQGDIWIHNTTGQVKVYTGSAWVDSKDVATNTLAQSKAYIYTTTNATAPTSPAPTRGDVWINTANGTTKIYSGTGWVDSTDPEARSIANSKITTYYNGTAPTAPTGGFTTGDLWVKTPENRMHRWSGSWVELKDSAITTAQQAADAAASAAATGIANAQNAFNLADGKAQVFWGGARPTNLVTADKGDIWVDTAKTPNEVQVWSGTAWAVTGDPATKTIAEAANTLAGQKSYVYTQTTTPSSPAPTRGDTWIHTTTGETKIYSGSAWIATTDPAAQAIANRKITTYYNSTTPAVPTGGHTAGDLWVKTPDNRLNRWSGAAWIEIKDAAITAVETTANNLKDTVIPALQGQVDDKIEVSVGGTRPSFASATPAARLAAKGDMHIDTTSGLVTVYSGVANTWNDVKDPAALSAANSAAALAGTKRQVFGGTVKPIQNTTTNLVAGDLWLDETTKRFWKWSGSTWIEFKDTAIDAAQTAANTANTAIGTLTGNLGDLSTQIDNKIEVFVQTTQPTLPALAADRLKMKGDMWINTAGTNKGEVKVYPGVGTVWEVVTDPAAKAAADAANVLADSKKQIFGGTTGPANNGTNALKVNDLWIRDTDKKMHRWTGSAWEIAQDKAISGLESKGTDLIINGTGILGDNYNFSRYTFDASDAPSGARGSFTSELYSSVLSADADIPYDTSKTYKVSYSMKRGNEASTGHYAGFIPLDAAGGTVSPRSYMFQSNTTTTLVNELKSGDTTIKVQNASAWNNAAGGSSHLRNIIIWNYTDSFGKTWAPHTYSRNYISNAYSDGGVNKTTGVITLTAPYSGLTVPAGTYLSNGSSGSTYMYSSNGVLQPEWTNYSATISGAMPDIPVGSSASRISATFRSGPPPGAAFLRFFVIANHYSWSVQGQSVTKIANVSMSDASAAYEHATSAMTSANARNRNIYSTDNATGVSRDGYTFIDGDTWYKRDSFDTVVNMWEFRNGSWITKTLNDQVIANLDAGKITAGTINADRIGANTISSAKLLVGNPLNLVDDGGFENNGAGWNLKSGVENVTVSVPAIGGSGAIRMIADGSYKLTTSKSSIEVEPGEEYLATVYIKNIGGASPTAGRVRFGVIHQRYDGGMVPGDYTWTLQDINSATELSGSWTKFEFNFKTPHGRRYMVPMFDLTSDNTTGATYYVDDFSIKRVSGTTLIEDGAITTDKIVLGGLDGQTVITNKTITTNEIAAETITAGNIAGGAITAHKIATQTITADKFISGGVDGSVIIQDGTITGTQIDAGSITAREIAAGSITTAKINAQAITAGKIDAGAIDASKIVVGGMDGATVIAGGSIVTSNIKAGNITTGLLAAEAVEADKIKAGAITTTQIAVGGLIGSTVIQDGTITTAKIETKAITADKIAAKTILVGNLANGSVDNTIIKDGSITTTKILADQITADHLMINSVTAGKIAALAINAGHIQAGAITIGPGKPIASGTVATPGDVTAAEGRAKTHGTDAANAAQTAAINAAATDAQTKATNAKNAAELAAKQYADGQITDVELRAVNVAAADAQTKATAAKNAAILAAEADATTKANNAKSQAISAAATDAQTKANNAKAAAELAAKQYADGQITDVELRAANTAASDAQTKATTAKNDAIAASELAFGGTKALVTGWKFPNSTFIDGGHIQTRTIAAEKIETDAIIARHIKTDAIEARHIQAGSITIGGVSSPINQTSLEAAIIDSREKDYGFVYSKTITLYGDHDKYYPVAMMDGDQSVDRQIMINRTYSELHPPEWQSATHGGGLYLLATVNHGGWGGTEYKQRIDQLQQQYNDTIGNIQLVPTGGGTYFFLRGGGTTGARYHIYSDQPLEGESLRLHDADTTTKLDKVHIFYNSQTIHIGSGGTYAYQTPAPLTQPNTVRINELSYVEASKTAYQLTNGWRVTGTTQINGGNIKTDSIEAAAIKTGSIVIGAPNSPLSASGIITDAKMNTERTNILSSAGTNADTKVSNAVGPINTAIGTINSNVTSVTNTTTQVKNLTDGWKGTGTSIKGSAIQAGTVSTGAIDGLTGFINSNGLVAAGSNAATTLNSLTALQSGVTVLEGGKIKTDSITTLQLAANAVIAENILAGTITGNKLAVDTTLTNNLYVGSDMTINSSGHIKSLNYDANGSAGFYLDHQQLIINQGKIRAAAIELQDSANIMPNAYASFNYKSGFYGVNNLWTSSITSANKIDSGGVFGGGALEVIASATGYLMLSPQGQVNIPIEGGREYILSFYVSNRSSKAFNIVAGLYQAGSAYVYAPYKSVANTTAWTRYSVSVTAPAAMTQATFRLNNTGSANYRLDGIQVEAKIAASDEPSSWSPPGLTSIDGESITTGSISSNAVINTGNGAIAKWSINTEGNARFGDVTVDGKMVVGGHNNAIKDERVSIQSDSYSAGNAGWIIKGNGDVEFNNGTFRGILNLEKVGNEPDRPTMKASVSPINLYTDEDTYQTIDVASIQGVTYAYDRAQTGGEGPYYPTVPLTSKIGRYYIGPTTDRAVNIQVHDGLEGAVYLENPPLDVALTSMYVGELTNAADAPVDREKQGFGYISKRVEADPNSPSRRSSTSISQSSSVQLRSPFYPELSGSGDYPESTHVLQTSVNFSAPLDKNLIHSDYALPAASTGGTVVRENRAAYSLRAYSLYNGMNKSTYLKTLATEKGNPVAGKQYIFSAYIDTLDAAQDVAVYAFANGIPMAPIGDRKMTAGQTAYQHAETIGTLAPQYRYEFDSVKTSYSNIGSLTQPLVKTQGYVYLGANGALYTSGATRFSMASSYSMTSGFSISLWMQPTSTTGSPQVIFHRATDTTRELWLTYEVGTQTLSGGLVNGGTFTWNAPNNTIDRGQWNHVTFTITGAGSGTTSIRAYVNGNLVESKTTPYWTGSFALQPMYLFGNMQNASFFVGGLAEPMIFHRTLSASDVTALYDRGAPMYRAGGLPTLSQNGILTPAGSDSNRVAFAYTPSTSVATEITLQTVSAKENKTFGYKLQLERASYQENMKLSPEVRSRVAPTPWSVNGSQSTSSGVLRLKSEPAPDIESWIVSSLGAYQRLGPVGVDSSKRSTPTELELQLSSSYNYPGGGGVTSTGITYKWGTAGMSYPGVKFSYMPTAFSIIWDYSGMSTNSRPQLGGSGSNQRVINEIATYTGKINTGAGIQISDDFTAPDGSEVGYPWISTGNPQMKIYENMTRCRLHNGEGGVPSDYVLHSEALVQTDQEVSAKIDSTSVLFGSTWRPNVVLIANYDSSTDSGIFARVANLSKTWFLYVVNNGAVTYSTSGTTANYISRMTDISLQRDGSRVTFKLGSQTLFNSTLANLPSGKRVGFNTFAGRLDSFQARDIVAGSDALGILQPHSININNGRGIEVHTTGVIETLVPGYYMVSATVYGNFGSNSSRSYWLDIRDDDGFGNDRAMPLGGIQASGVAIPHISGSGVFYLSGRIELRAHTSTTTVSRIDRVDFDIARMM